MKNFKNKMLTLMLVTGIFLFASFNSGYANDILNNYEITYAVNPVSCCLEITFTNTNVILDANGNLLLDENGNPLNPLDYQLRCDIFYLDWNGNELVETLSANAEGTRKYEVCPVNGESFVQYSITITHLATTDEYSPTNQQLVTFDLTGLCDSDDPCEEYTGLSDWCVNFSHDTEIIELTPCCSLKTDYCYCVNEVDDQIEIIITEVTIIAKCGNDDCDTWMSDVRTNFTDYLTSSYKSIYQTITSQNAMLTTPCPEAGTIMTRWGHPSCWNSEWLEVLVFIPGNGLLPEFGGIPDSYRTEWIMAACDGADIIDIDDLCWSTYWICWEYDIVTGTGSIKETLIESNAGIINCGPDCDYICE